jgi:nitrate/nitrite transport system ATP-binding protein
MTNGPFARVAESVKVSIERPRDRTTIVHDPGYYPIRTHLVDFLVSRSRELSERDDAVRDAGHTREVRAEAMAPVAVDPAADARAEAAGLSRPHRPDPHAAPLKAVNGN